MSTPAHLSMQKTVRRFVEAQRSQRTAKTYGKIAEAFLASLANERSPSRRDVDLFLARPLKSGARASVSTYNQMLAAFRAFARFAIEAGLWNEDPTSGLTFLREPEKEPAVLLVPEVQRFFLAASEFDPRKERARNLAILALCFALGLRLSELVRLDTKQVDLASSTLLDVVRKGGRVQNLPLEKNAAELLQRWLKVRPKAVKPKEMALFVSARGTRLSGRSIERLFERLRKQTGTPKRVTPHTARHSFITLELALGADISVVSRIAGHASVATTMRYRHLLDHEPRKAVGMLGIIIPRDILAASSELASEIRAPGAEAIVLIPTAPANDNSQKDVDDQEDLGGIR